MILIWSLSLLFSVSIITMLIPSHLYLSFSSLSFLFLFTASSLPSLIVIQEDEATLIGVGAVLGALSGLAQVPFY
jgi:hypothetical protein